MPEEAPPNIFLFITDQQRYDTIKSLGYEYMETPNLDRLVNEGVAFTQCHVTAPSCAPSRASLFTGLYPHSHGILKNADRWRHSWVETLAKTYYCVNIGKMHTCPMDTPLGFHERYVVENKDRFLEERYFYDEWDKALHARGLVKQQRELYRQRPDYRERMGAFDWELPEDMQSDMFVGNTAKWWLQTKPKPDKPLFMEIGFPGPHPPYDPTSRFIEKYKGKDLPLPQIKQEDVEGQPQAFKDLRQHNFEVDHDSVVHLDNPDQDTLQRLWEYYLANVSMIDEKIGEILDTLEARGYLENAIILFTSDHGEALGEHGHIQKWTMYDCVTRVPLIAWSPKLFPGGRKLDGLCQLMDVGATILDLAGIERPEWMAADTLLPALKGAEHQGRPFVIAEHGRDMFLNTIEFVTMIRNQRWKLVHFLDRQYGQLFDLETDPAEEINLWDSQGHAETKERLLRELFEFRVRSGYQTRTLWQEVR